jgi:hypothetical protein
LNSLLQPFIPLLQKFPPDGPGRVALLAAIAVTTLLVTAVVVGALNPLAKAEASFHGACEVQREQFARVVVGRQKIHEALFKAEAIFVRHCFDNKEKGEDEWENNHGDRHLS